MRILLFYFAELGGLGGVEVVVQNLARAFNKSGHQAGIVELARHRRPKRTLPGGIPVWSVTAPSYTTWRRPRSWASFARSTLQFLRIIRDFQPHFVNVHFPLAQSIPVVGATYLPHSWRLVATIHGSDIRVMPHTIPPIRVWQKRLFARSDLVTAVSGAVLADAALLYPGLMRKAEVIHNGVGESWFQSPANSSALAKQYLLYVGRFHEVKGVDILLRAWQLIVPRHPDLNLWLVGGGGEQVALRSLAESLGIASRVQFLGRKDQSELAQLYRDARVVVLPSRREGLPMTLLEAGASGALRVATRLPGISDILQDGTDGFLAEPESPDSLAQALTRVLELPQEQALEVRAKARENVLNKFSEDSITSTYLACFAKLQ
jgi:glycosyltransferase involved in cell wall biosynthesis